MHTPPWQASPLVQALPSSHGVVSASAVPAQRPPWQVSLLVQEFSSSHAAPSSSAALPTQVPFWQVSAAVQALPSSQLVPVSGVTAQLAVPSQVRVLHVSEVQVMAVPTHCPLPSQVSLNVQVLPSSHAAPVLGVTVQLDVPLQVRVLQVSEVQVMAVLWQTPPSQVSMVQAFWSSQSLAAEQGVQPASAVLWQTPASQVSVVQAFWSLQSAAVEQGVQPARAVLWQTPSQESVVQAFWSSQSAAVVQGVQPAVAVPAHCPLPSQTSLKVQALPSSHGVSAGWKASGGQYTLVPVQVSAASHASIPAR